MFSQSIKLFLSITIYNLFVFCDDNDYTLRLIREDDNKYLLVNRYETWTAQAIYRNKINETGFAFIEIETNPNITNEIQAYTAGFIEGSLTYDLIYGQWYNTIKNFCSDTKINCSRVNEFIESNTIWIKNKIKENLTDSYWHHVKLYYDQMKGILDGYNAEALLAKYPPLTWNDIIWMNLLTEVMDINEAFGGNHEIGNGHCSVLIKILSSNKDIYFGHNTWAVYQSMLRLQKKYVFGYQKSTNSSEKIPGIEIAFTSYPASITSMDDFYLISSGLAVTETTNEIFNKTLWKFISSENMVWESIRSVVANRLANDGQSWSDIFKLYNSGTYNNQWMVLDYKKFKPGNIPNENAFWVIEQVPSKIVSEDLTKHLIEKGYWASYNIPYFEEIYRITDYNSMAKKFGNWFNYTKAPRAKIFDRDHINVTNMDSFMKLMRSNDFEHEPFAHCDCNPPYSAAGAIAARNDLSSANGTYQFKGQSHRPTGALDAKITNSNLFLKLQFTAISGPTTGTNDKLPIFKWSTSNFTNVPHLMHPDEWNFKPVTYKWSLPFNN